MMERDFMGLAVKQETSDEVIDAAPLRSAAMEWPLSNNCYDRPQLFPLPGSHQERPMTGFDSLASAGLVTITTTEIDSDHKSYSAVMQKNIVPENQGGVRYTVTTYPTNPTKLMASPPIGASVHQSFVPLSPEPISAIPMVNPVPAMSSSSSVVGTTDLKNSSKISGAPAQLTIFFNGSVCVYNNVSADKAQAIMLLAGNGPQEASSAVAPAAPVQASAPRPSILESFVVNHPYGATAHRSSPAAKAPISVSQSIGWGTLSDMTGSKQRGVLVSSNKVEPLKVANSPASATFLPSSIYTTVPLNSCSLLSLCLSLSLICTLCIVIRQCTSVSEEIFGSVSGEAQGEGNKCSAICRQGITRMQLIGLLSRASSQLIKERS